jgi:hypothetical protein
LKFFSALDGVRRLAKAALTENDCFQHLTDEGQNQASELTIRSINGSS